MDTTLIFIIVYGVLCLIAAGFGADKKVGFFTGLALALFFTPPVSVICAFVSGDKVKPEPSIKA